MLLQQNSQHAHVRALPHSSSSTSGLRRSKRPSTRGPQQQQLQDAPCSISASSCTAPHCRDVRACSYSRTVMSTDFPDAPFNRTHAFDWLDQWYPVGFVK